jgi:hypothetical protein
LDLCYAADGVEVNVCGKVLHLQKSTSKNTDQEIKTWVATYGFIHEDASLKTWMHEFSRCYGVFMAMIETNLNLQEKFKYFAAAEMVLRLVLCHRDEQMYKQLIKSQPNSDHVVSSEILALCIQCMSHMSSHLTPDEKRAHIPYKTVSVELDGSLNMS